MGSWSDGAEGLVVLPDGRRLRGRGLRYGRSAAEELPEFGLYLTARPHEAGQWDSRRVRWPDFWLPYSTAETVAALREAHDRAASHTVEIACRGGVRRTGTAIAILARLAGVPALEAVAWTRAHYRAGAVETPWQQRFVARVEISR